jgi:hypothetical protein
MCETKKREIRKGIRSRSVHIIDKLSKDKINMQATYPKGDLIEFK